MANIKSQIKRNRQNEKRHERNKAVRSELKTRVKVARTALVVLLAVAARPIASVFGADGDVLGYALYAGTQDAPEYRVLSSQGGLRRIVRTAPRASPPAS